LGTRAHMLSKATLDNKTHITLNHAITMTQKIIILNAGTKTRRAFSAGLETATLEKRKTKEMILHIKNDLSITYLGNNTPISFSNSYVFTRLRASDAHFCGMLYEHLEAMGIAASDPINTSFAFSEEKIAQMPRLARALIPIPETIIAREESFIKNEAYILEHITFPLVYKTDGSQGNNVHKVETLAELKQHISAKKKHQLFLLQQLIPNTFDTRTIVAFGKVLGSIKRTAQHGQFLNNVAKGADVEMYTLTKEEEEIAVRAAQVNNIDFGGVDMIHTIGGPVILEVNKSPQIRGFEKVYGEQFVFSTIARMIEERK